MFNELVESSDARERTNKGWTVTLSALVQCVILVVLILIPLIYMQALPKAVFSTVVMAPPPPPPPSPPPAAAPAKSTQPVARLIDHGVIEAPRAIPGKVEVLTQPDLPPEAGGRDAEFGSVNALGETLSILGNNSPSVAPPPPPKPAQTIVKLGGKVAEARLTNRVQPNYPALARQARITGVVVLHAIIAKDGTISQLEVISGHPLLVQAALDAVKQWRYQPEVLNGDPVEVDTTITVNFQLGGG
jgi:periplasmic protein TonB